MFPLNRQVQVSVCICFQESFSLIAVFICSSLLPYFYFLLVGGVELLCICWIIFTSLLYPLLLLESFRSFSSDFLFMFSLYILFLFFYHSYSACV